MSEANFCVFCLFESIVRRSRVEDDKPHIFLCDFLYVTQRCTLLIEAAYFENEQFLADPCSISSSDLNKTFARE